LFKTTSKHGFLEIDGKEERQGRKRKGLEEMRFGRDEGYER
jgi:hypothetical protein